MKVNVKRLVFLFITIFTMCMIFYFSSQNADTSSNTSSGFAEIMAKILYPGFEKLSEAKRTDIINDCQFAVRKTAHFSIYGALGVFSCLTMNTYKNLKIWAEMQFLWEHAYAIPYWMSCISILFLEEAAS